MAPLSGSTRPTPTPRARLRRASLAAACALLAAAAGADCAALEGGDLPAPTLVIGTNAPGSDEPDAFVPLTDGALLDIVVGFQGAWMVVLALETSLAADLPVAITMTLRSAEEVLGHFTVSEQALVAGDSGDAYYLDFYLVVSSAEHAGEVAWVDASVVDERGWAASATVRVRLATSVQTAQRTPAAPRPRVACRSFAPGGTVASAGALASTGVRPRFGPAASRAARRRAPPSEEPSHEPRRTSPVPPSPRVAPGPPGAGSGDPAGGLHP